MARWLNPQRPDDQVYPRLTLCINRDTHTLTGIRPTETEISTGSAFVLLTPVSAAGVDPRSERTPAGLGVGKILNLEGEFMTGAWMVAAMLAASVPSTQSDHALPAVATGSAATPEASRSETAPHRRDWLFDVAMAGVSGGNASDLTLTLYALNRGHGEANPVLHPLGRHPVALAAAKTVMTVSTMYALLKLHDRRPKLATSIAIGAAAVMLAVSAHNADLLHRPPH
jgi:hypothetical protein